MFFSLLKMFLINLISNSPASELEQHPVPMTNIALPKRKMKNITTAYPSKLHIRNFCGNGSGCGGFGHEEAQSTQEQAGFIPCGNGKKGDCKRSFTLRAIASSYIE
jgi:hypothetical protein